MVSKLTKSVVQVSPDLHQGGAFAHVAAAHLLNRLSLQKLSNRDQLGCCCFLTLQPSKVAVPTAAAHACLLTPHLTIGQSTCNHSHLQEHMLCCLLQLTASHKLINLLSCCSYMRWLCGFTHHGGIPLRRGDECIEDWCATKAVGQDVGQRAFAWSTSRIRFWVSNRKGSKTAGKGARHPRVGCAHQHSGCHRSSAQQVARPWMPLDNAQSSIWMPMRCFALRAGRLACSCSFNIRSI